MSYTGMGVDTYAASHWTIVASSGGPVCKPNDAEALSLFKEVQRLVNRLRAKKGQKLLAVDGRIGPATVSAIRDLQAPGAVLVFTCNQITGRIYTVIDELAGKVVELNAPPVADPKTPSPPSMPGPSGTVVNPTDAQIAAAAAAAAGAGGGFLDTLKSPLGITALVVGGLLVWKLSGKGKRRNPGRRRGGYNVEVWDPKMGWHVSRAASSLKIAREKEADLKREYRGIRTQIVGR